MYYGHVPNNRKPEEENQEIERDKIYIRIRNETNRKLMTFSKSAYEYGCDFDWTPLPSVTMRIIFIYHSNLFVPILWILWCAPHTHTHTQREIDTLIP